MPLAPAQEQELSFPCSTLVRPSSKRAAREGAGGFYREPRGEEQEVEGCWRLLGVIWSPWGTFKGLTMQ